LAQKHPDKRHEIDSMGGSEEFITVHEELYQRKGEALYEKAYDICNARINPASHKVLVRIGMNRIPRLTNPPFQFSMDIRKQ
jgi:hypothetical protein